MIKQALLVSDAPDASDAVFHCTVLFSVSLL